MLICYCYSCGGWGVACYTTSPQRMIPPPIKRARILVSGGVVIVISVKLYEIKSLAATLGCAYPAGKFPFPHNLRQSKKWPLTAAQMVTELHQSTHFLQLLPQRH